jgi:hypothetical protein
MVWPPITIRPKAGAMKPAIVRLSTTRFAEQASDLAGRQLEIESVEHPARALRNSEIDPDTLDLKRNTGGRWGVPDDGACGGDRSVGRSVHLQMHIILDSES